MVELPDGEYEINTSTGIVKLVINSQWYCIHTARFAKYSGKVKYFGEVKALEDIIQNQKINNYAFDDCKTFISCSFEEKFSYSTTEFEAITDEQCSQKYKSILLENGIYYTDSKDLQNKVDEQFAVIMKNQLSMIKEKILIDDRFSNLHKVYAYYEALNTFLKNYSYVRGHFWVQKLDENILEGTLMQDYIDEKIYKTVTFIGLVPSIMPFRKKYPEIEPEKMIQLKDRMKNKIEMPVEEELILVARGLWYRLEYRSAVIESSAALEIAVEKKLVEKMNSCGMSQIDIDTELKKTEKNFKQRCDVFLQRYTGASFVKDNPVLWNIIDSHRKIYRHKIVHSDIMPDRSKTENIINDFEKAIQCIIYL